MTTIPKSPTTAPNGSRNTHHGVTDTHPTDTRNPSPRHSRENHDLPLSETDPKAAKQKAAEDKLQMLSIVQAMQQGKMPHNSQLDEILDKLVTNRVISSREHLMSPDGKILLGDFRKLLKTVQKALAVKNKDELFQSLVYHLHCMESPISKEQLGESIKVSDKSVINEEGKKGSDALFRIGKLILLNNEFRELLGELIDISQEIFSSVSKKAGDSLSNAASGLQNEENHPNKSGKNFVDKYLDKVMDYTHNRKIAKPQQNQTQEPHVSIATQEARISNGTQGLPLPNHSGQEKHHSSIHDQEPHLVSSPHDDPRHQGLLNTGDSVHPKAIPGGFPTTNSLEEKNTIDQSPHYPQESNPIHHKQEHGSLGQQPIYHQQVNPNLIQQRGDITNKQTSTNGSMPNKYQEKIENNQLYQNARNEMYDNKNHARATLKNNVPEEKQEELLNRLQLAVAQIQKHQEYKVAIHTLIQLIKTWSTRLTQVTEGIKTHAKEGDHPQQNNFREQSERELKSIIECWSQGYSIDPLLQGVQRVMQDMQKDEQLREFYQNVVQYVDKLVTEPGYVQQERSTQEGRQLMDRGNHIIKGRYRDNLQFLSTESRKIMTLMAEDDISRELNHRFATIHRDLWMDSEGNPAFKPQLLNDMKMTLLPAFIDEIKYIPIPRIDYSDPQYDIVIENLVISGDSLLPNVFETKVESFNSFSLKSESPSPPSHQSLNIRMSEIQADIDDIVFFYNKKTGFPKITDHGVASLIVGGKGISISLRIQTVVDNPAKTFKVASCKCNVDNLKIKIHDSNHNMLYKAIQPLILGSIRKQIAKVMELKVTEMLNKVDQKVTQSIVEMNQNLQNKAYQSLPENEQHAVEPPSLSQARPRPGILSAVVNIINSNIKNKVQKRNEAKRMERMSMSQDGILSVHSNNQFEGGQLNVKPTNFDEDSVATNRHHYIASPPLSPTSKNSLHATGHNNPITHSGSQSPKTSQYKLAQDMTDTQDLHTKQQQPTQV